MLDNNSLLFFVGIVRQDLQRLKRRSYYAKRTHEKEGKGKR